MTYKYLDKVLEKLVKRIYRLFQKYRATKFDELNVVSSVRELYEQLDALNREAYEDIARHYYESEPHGDDELDDAFIAELLRTPSGVMKYSYDAETLRKRDRLVEALIASELSPSEFDTAMRLWTQQTGWFAVDVADKALETARIASEVKRVRWVSEKDNRVCKRCIALNGRVFLINKVPDKPHPNCRCRIVRVKSE